jgi:hypothetical protein
MEKKINVAELLKNCPSGMELDSPMYDNLYFDCLEMEEDITYPVCCYIDKGVKTSVRFNKFGQFDKDSKCVIFPKGKTTWEGFVPPHCKFKDGDIVATANGSFIGITTGGKRNQFIPTYCIVKYNGEYEGYFGRKENWCFDRLATEEEKQKLFDAIKEHGYKWNAEAKILEKLTKKKFDISNLKPFDKVLVRVCDSGKWCGDFYMWYDCKEKDYPYNCACGVWGQCIPFEGNQHLLGKRDNCDKFFKTWE